MWKILFTRDAYVREKSVQMQMNACKRIKHSQPSALQSTCEHEDKSAKRYKRSVSKVFRSPKRANVSCNSHDQHFAIRCDLQRCKEPRDPSLMQSNFDVVLKIHTTTYCATPHDSDTARLKNLIANVTVQHDSPAFYASMVPDAGQSFHAADTGWLTHPKYFCIR